MVRLGSNSTFTLSTRIQIRKACAEDLPLLEWYGEYTHFRRIYQRTFQEQQRGRRLMLVAEMNNFPIAQVFVLLKLQRGRRQDTTAYIYSLRVIAHLRGLGIGSHLLRYAEALLMQRGYRWVVISVAKENVKARRLYERFGYKVYAEDDGHWSYENHRGEVIEVTEPAWMLHKKLQ